MNFICDNISFDKNGTLLFAGLNIKKLAEKYSTPLYLYDENKIRANCFLYKKAIKQYFPEGSFPAYAGKAACFKQLYRIMREEKMAVDLVSSGEIFTAFSAGYNLGNAIFHGNCKTDFDIAYAISCGVGFFAVDNFEELNIINSEAEKKGIIQNILLRITPGIDPHTYSAVNTGCVDSKFGCAIETGQAEAIFKEALHMKNIHISGFHCHIGSQVFEEDVFERAAEIMIKFISDIKYCYDFETEYLNLGGGIGVRYVESDPKSNITERIKSIGNKIRSSSLKFKIKEPKIILEPGRSIVANAGMTVYSVGSIKKIPGYKNYVCIDGGMADNPRFALYGSKYTCLFAENVFEQCGMKCDIAGRCCESGDIIAKDVYMPSTIKRGDIVTICTTGAYNYSMSSNYNRLSKPAVVMIKDGRDYVAVKRETLESITENDL